ncbi:hypothetical protein SOP94_16025 [Peribacillus frigoritolerans]|uniref:hypothetical protein n=1 Tax=Peribacillus frigoritolerans TaxID=450367 RepID=UPI002B241A70|nr:hypothetical protein [Peribacillus frigoritolerans]MEB2629966.1 hypothetical protein [Peribacillus frigoritolerans]
MIDEGFADLFLKNMVSKTAGKVYGKRGPSGIREHKVLSMEEVFFDACFVDNISIP